MKSSPWEAISAIFGGLAFLLALLVDFPKLGIWRRVIVSVVLGVAVFFVISQLVPSVFSLPVSPKATSVQSLTPTLVAPTASGNADSTFYDDFNNALYDNTWNPNLWTYNSSEGGDTKIVERDGVLVLSRQGAGNGGLYAISQAAAIDKNRYIEAKLNLDGHIQASGGDIGIGVNSDGWWINCVIYKAGGSAYARCATNDYATASTEVGFNTWHTMRLEISSDGSTVSFFCDGSPIGHGPFNHTQFSVEVSVFSSDGGLVTGYVDDVRIWR